MGKKIIPGLGWHGMVVYSKGGLRICVGNGAMRERPSLHGREDINRIHVAIMTWLHLTIGCTLFIIEQALPISSTLMTLMTVTVFSFIDLVLIECSIPSRNIVYSLFLH